MPTVVAFGTKRTSPASGRSWLPRTDMADDNLDTSSQHPGSAIMGFLVREAERASARVHYTSRERCGRAAACCACAEADDAGDWVPGRRIACRVREPHCGVSPGARGSRVYGGAKCRN